MRRILVLFPVISLFIGFLSGEQTSLSGPIEGFIFDSPTGSFRAVIGLPGSASLGPAILSGFGDGSVAPQKDYGLAFGDGRNTLVSGLSTASPSTSVLATIDRPEGAAWSGDGSLAILFSRTGNWIQTLAGLPNAPTPGASTDLSYLSGSVSAIAADTTGKRVAIAVTGDAGSVYLITNSGDPVPVVAASKPIALTFSDDGNKLYVLDGAGPQLIAVQLADLTTQTFSLDGLADPVAIKQTRDGANRQVLYVAGRNDSLLRTYDAASLDMLTDTSLDFLPTEVNDFGRNSFLLAPRLNDKGPLWIFTNAPRQAVYFVPPMPTPVGGPQ